jgi:hypothetical protein
LQVIPTTVYVAVLVLIPVSPHVPPLVRLLRDRLPPYRMLSRGLEGLTSYPPPVW